APSPAPVRVPSVGTLYQPVPVMSRPATPAGISTSFTSTFSTLCISPIPSSTSIRVRLPSLRANTIGGLYHAVPYTIGTKSLYRAAFTETADVCQFLSPEVRTEIFGGTNSMPPKFANMPRAWQSLRVYPHDVNAAPLSRLPAPPTTPAE